jgi:DNA-binding CsgD family transcriptional regulator
MTCCTRRRDDGTIDREEIDRAVQGRPATLSPREAQIAMFRLSRERRWGLQRIANQLGYSRSQVAAKLAEQRRGAPSA